MNNDIKEILDYYRKNNEKYEKSMLSQFNEEQLKTTFHVSYQRYKNHKALLDYITNLQELCNKYEEEHSTTFNYWKQLIKEDYKSRCEKAIKYINSTGYGTDFSMNAEEVDVLFNILKGSE